MHYIASDHRYISGLSAYFDAQGCKLVDYEPERLKDGSFILLIFSPVRCGSVRVSLERVWKKGMELENREAILLNAGFEEAQETNYFDLLNPPANWSDFIALAKPAKLLWEPVYTGGMKMEDKLARFFKGHGAESLTDELYVIRRKTASLFRAMDKYGLPYEVAAAEAFETDNVWRHWEVLKSRWSHYFPLFFYLPFSGQMKKIDASIKQIDPFFRSEGKNGDLFIQLECHQIVEYIHETLFTIEKSYVKGNI
ncbi:MAG: hypothetical protein SH848_16625 [Saprospiraceae bacterium]|nr:hypothetical protein [Saprospiraceae bacterium]